MNKSFTLIEILVVIVVVGIISAFILVGVSSISNKANVAKGQAFVDSLDNALLMSRISNWKLDENTNDSWGTNTGTWYGAGGGSNLSVNYKSSSDCVSNQCLDFDGTDDYVDYGDILRPSRNNNRTYSFWMNPRSFSGIIFGSGNMWQSAGGYSKFHVISSTEIQISYDILNSPYRVTFNCPVDRFKWNYFTVSFDSISSSSNVTIKLYKNGSFISSSTQARRTSAGYNIAFIIGAVNNDSDDHKIWFFNGQIDDFRVYDSLVSSQKIRENYFSGFNNLYENKELTKIEYHKRIGELKSNLSNNE